ncbi:hypothetical protein [Endozoicomonas sp. ALE010]|uniref:hypothetical protein n=1 Tax=Endozoicomonas sp. ALE010 TaxID=3403081 RepID=UPI003BB627D2
MRAFVRWGVVLARLVILFFDECDQFTDYQQQCCAILYLCVLKTGSIQAMEREILKQRLYSFLLSNPDQPVNVLARNTGASKALVNNVLYKDTCFGSTSSEPPLWHVVPSNTHTEKPVYKESNKRLGS